MFRRWLRLLNLVIQYAFAAAAAVAFSQFFAFIQQYQQRLGGHLDESRRSLQTITDGARDGDAGQQQLIDALGTRVADLEYAYDTVFAAPALIQPVIFLIHLDLAVARGTAGDFAPQIALDFASLVYAVIGLVLAVMAYRGFAVILFGGRPRAGVKPDTARGRRRSR